MPYADYEYYVNEYHGDVISEDAFEKMATRASDYIDYITLGRAEQHSARHQVKKACCALAEAYLSIERAKAASASVDGEVASESVGSWSRRYYSSTETADSSKQELYKVAQMYLSGIGLISRAVSCGCPCSHTL